MDIEERKKKIKKVRLIFFPVLIITFLMFINSFIKQAYFTSQGFPENQTIVKLVDLIYKYIPPLKWVKAISPRFNYHEFSSIGFILSILVLGLLMLSAKKIGDTTNEKRRLKKLEQEVEDEDIKNQFRKNK